MSVAREPYSLQERYESLQDLCKQLLMVNETLKNELDKLSVIYRKAVDERSLLLSELVEHHSSCSAAFNADQSATAIHQKRPISIHEESFVSKKLRHDSLSSKAKAVSSYDRTSDTGISKPIKVFHPNNQRSAENPDDFSLPIHESPSSSRSSLTTISHPSFTAQEQDSANKWRPADENPCLSRATVSVDEPITSPVTIGSTPLQRPAKPHSLVTSSVVTSSGITLSYVQTSATRTSLTGIQNLKNLPVVNRNANIIQTSNAPRNVSSGVLLSSTPPILVNSQGAFRGAKPIQSPQTTAALRVTGSSGQRIVIQPTSGNARPLLIHPPENNLSGLSGD